MASTQRLSLICGVHNAGARPIPGRPPPLRAETATSLDSSPIVRPAICSVKPSHINPIHPKTKHSTFRLQP